MKVLVIGSDRKLFEKSSDVRNRVLEYGGLFEELHVVVFSKERFAPERIAENVWLYPTNSRSRFLYVIDAVHIGKRVFRKARFRRSHDVISCQDPFEAGLAGWFLKHASGVSLHLQIHTDFLSPYFSAESLLNRMRVKIARFLLPRADGIRVVSKRIQDSLRDISGVLRSRVTSLPIRTVLHTDVSEGRPVSNDSFVLLMASRLEKEKNIEMAIDACAELKKETPSMPVFLKIYGGGSRKKNLDARIRDKGMSGYARISPEENPLTGAFFGRGDVFLVTSNYEGYGRSVMEAMMAGSPIIMTDVGVAGDVIRNGENGIVIPVGDKEALKKAITELYENREKGVRMGKRARADVVKYTYKDKEEYLSLYKKSLEQCAQ